MARKRKRPDPGMSRASVSLPVEDYAEIERIAQQNRVSIAWVIREAVTQYLAERSPLFRASEIARTHQGGQ